MKQDKTGKAIYLRSMLLKKKPPVPDVCSFSNKLKEFSALMCNKIVHELSIEMDLGKGLRSLAAAISKLFIKPN